MAGAHMQKRQQSRRQQGTYEENAGTDSDNSTRTSDDEIHPNGTNKRRRRQSRTGKAKPATKQSATCVERSSCHRLPTYVARKLEKESLTDEITLLEAQLELLKLQVGLPTEDVSSSLASLQTSNANIEEAIHTNLLGVARFQSLLAQHLLSMPVDPMATSIHLTRDKEERRTTLRALKDTKLRRAQELVADRLDGLDPLKAYFTEERFLTRGNVYHCKRFDIHQFRGLPNGAKQLYDALLYYMFSMEISITEMLGQLTIREDMDAIEPILWNHRLISTTGAGYVQELNTAGFARFVDAHDNEESHTPYGLIAADAVDADELYPYDPREHVRKDVTAAITISEVSSDPNDPLAETVVVLKRCVFVTIHTPAIVLPTSVMNQVVANVDTWSNVMAAFLRDAVAPSHNHQK